MAEAGLVSECFSYLPVRFGWEVSGESYTAKTDG
jgi:hypothetical protein